MSLPLTCRALVVALAAASTRAQLLWAGNCGDATCGHQGAVAGPGVSSQLVTLWQVATGAIRPNALTIRGEDIGAPSDVDCASPLCRETFVIAAAGTLSAAYNYSQFAHSPAALQFASPSLLAGRAGSVAVAGQGWQSSINGSFFSTLWGASASNGSVVWSLPRWDGLWGDVAASTSATGATAGLLFALFSTDNTLLAIDAESGAVAWSLALGPAGAAGRAAAEASLFRTLTLSADTATAFVLDTSAGVSGAFSDGTVTAIDLVHRKVAWAACPSHALGAGPLGPGTIRGTYHAASRALLLPNASALISLAEADGAAAAAAPFPDVLFAPDRLGLAVDAPTGRAFVWGTIDSGNASQSGAPVVYAYEAGGGGGPPELAARYDFPGQGTTGDYIKWGDALALDGAGSVLVVSMLGPLLPPREAAAAALAAPAAGARAEPRSRALQGGGSVYVAAVAFDAAAGSFSSVITPAPAQLQAGTPLIAMGPGARQISIASAGAVALLQG